MDERDVINLGFVIKNRAYHEALVYAMRSRNRFTINQNCLESDNDATIDDNTDVLICDENIDCLVSFFQRLRHRERYPRFILVLHSLEDQLIDRYISTGVHGFICYDEGLDKLEECIIEVYAGRLYYPARITQRFLNTLTDNFRYHTNVRSEEISLTPRQVSVIRLIETGCSNKEIARKLDIELATVKNHVHVILNKLNAKNRSEAVSHYRNTSSYQVYNQYSIAN